MSWRENFQAAFFSEWARHGLPESAASSGSAEAWPRIRCGLAPPATPAAAGELPRALDPAILDSVYGFGVFIGEELGTLAGIPAARRRKRAEFCGRFNLGISLFDFVCDESGSEEFAGLSQLPSLRMFTGTAGGVTPDTATLQFLDRVVRDVLDGFVAELGVPSRKRPTGLWRSLYQMFAAEMARARATPDASGSPLVQVRGILRSSASEPFRVMAQWMACGQPGAQARRARSLGRAVGDCFWLVDDAKDVWDDLHARRWNLLLVEAQAAEPALRLGTPSPLLEQRLLEIWDRQRTAQRCARRVVGTLARELECSAANRRQKRATASHLHAALHAWYA